MNYIVILNIAQTNFRQYTSTNFAVEYKLERIYTEESNQSEITFGLIEKSTKG